MSRAIVITNKFPKACASCGVRVAKSKGFAIKAAGKWTTYCSSAQCLGVHADAARERSKPVPRTLTQGDDCLVISMPYDRDALPVLRSMPGAKWDPDAKAWTVSASALDRPRVLKAAQLLGLVVDPALRADEPEPTCPVEILDYTKGVGAYPYQLDGVQWLAGRDRALLGDEMGLGKTLQLLCAAPRDHGVLAVVPASLKGNWRAEAAKWRPDLAVGVLSGRGSLTRWPRAGEVFIINPELLPPTKGEVEAKALRAKYKERISAAELGGDYPRAARLIEERDRMLEGIKRQKISREVDLAGDPSTVTLFADEAHMYKSHKALRSKRMKALASQVARAWPATGTPVLNRPVELWGVLSTFGLESRVFGSWGVFARCFGGEKQQVSRTQSRWVFSGAQGPEAAERLRNHMLRRTRAEVLPDLPPKTRTWMEISLSRKSRKVMDTLAAEGWGDLLDCLEPGDKLPTIDEISRLRAAIAEERIPAMLEFVEQYEDADEPLIVFSAHRAPIEALAHREGWGVIHGGVTSDERTRVVEAFQRGDLRGIAATIKTGGVGHTMTRASHMLFVDPEWVPALNAQAEDRICRIGQDADAVNYTYMVGDHPLDRQIAKLLASKEALAAAVLEDKHEYTPQAEVTSGPVVCEESADDQNERKCENMRDPRKLTRVRIYLDQRREVAQTLADEEKLTPELIRTIEAAFEQMCMSCDGAQRRDAAGWNKPDSERSKWLMMFDFSTCATAALAAWSMCLGYPRQLKNAFPTLWDNALKGRAK